MFLAPLISETIKRFTAVAEARRVAAACVEWMGFQCGLDGRRGGREPSCSKPGGTAGFCLESCRQNLGRDEQNLGRPRINVRERSERCVQSPRCARSTPVGALAQQRVGAGQRSLAFQLTFNPLIRLVEVLHGRNNRVTSESKNCELRRSKPPKLLLVEGLDDVSHSEASELPQSKPSMPS